MSTSPTALFNGTSTYSTDFANVISRAVQIASLPITLLNTQVTTLTNEQTDLNNLSSTFSSLQSAVSSLSTAAASGNYAISYSDDTVASASASSGAYLGTYQLEVDDPGSQANAVSTGTVADPTKSSISTALSFTLTANGSVFNNITPASNTLNSLADAINTATQGAVQATIVNIGTTSAPSYQLSLQNSAYGADPITLNDGSTNLMGTPTTATSVQYRINGQPAAPANPLSSNTRALTIAPNVSVTVLNAGTTSITVGQSTDAIATALTSFVKAYNAAATALAAERGTPAASTTDQSSGALAGNSLINTLSQSLRDITGYSGNSATGSIQSISDLGLSFDQNLDGLLSFDPTKLSAANLKDVTAFLGDPVNGGFLQNATDTMNGLMDPTSGAIPVVLLSTAQEISDTNDQISTDQDRVNLLTTDLQAQMASADTLVASLQQQLTYMTNLFTSMTANQNAGLG